MVTLFFRLNFVWLLLISDAFLIFVNKVIVLLITLLDMLAVFLCGWRMFLHTSTLFS